MAFAATLTIQKISAAAAPVTDYPYTMYAQAKNATALAHYVFQILSANNATNIGAIIYNGIFVHYITAPALTSAVAEGLYSYTTWNSLIAIGSNATSRLAKLNGGAAGQDTTNAALLNFAKMDLLASLANNVREMAECAIWSAALNVDEQNSLLKGFSPRRIRPQSRVFYSPLIRNLQDLQKALALTAVNSPTVAAHPRCYP